MPEVAARVDTRHAREPDGWRKTRLLAVKLAARGESTSAEIAELCGIARGHVFVWLRVVRERGLDALLQRAKPGPQEGMCRGVKPKVLEDLRAQLAANELATAEQARRWLKKKHRVERPYLSVWRWLKKERRSAAGAASQSLPEKAGSGRGVQRDAVRKTRGPRA